MGVTLLNGVEVGHRVASGRVQAVGTIRLLDTPLILIRPAMGAVGAWQEFLALACSAPVVRRPPARSSSTSIVIDFAQSLWPL
jgi:hypothetical protein